MLVLLYLKLQAKLITLLALGVVFPFVMNILFMTPPIPNLHYLFLIGLIVIKFVVFNDDRYHQKVIKIAKAQLTKELNSSPSRNILHKRTKDIENSRDVVILATALTIVILAIFQ